MAVVSASDDANRLWSQRKKSGASAACILKCANINWGLRNLRVLILRLATFLCCCCFSSAWWNTFPGAHTPIQWYEYKQSPIMRGSASDGLFKNSPPLPAHSVCDWWSLVRCKPPHKIKYIYGHAVCFIYYASGRWGTLARICAPRSASIFVSLSLRHSSHRKGKREKEQHVCVCVLSDMINRTKTWAECSSFDWEPAGNANTQKG